MQNQLSLEGFDVILPFAPFNDANFRPALYEVGRISFKQARGLVKWGHYTHSLTKGRFCFGMFRLGALVGVAVFGQPSGRGVAASIWHGGNEQNTLELLRLFVADGTGKNAESWFLARCNRAIPSEVEMLVAYSAPGAGHHGGCYQASNWLYLGRSNTGQSYYYMDVEGNYVNKRIPWQYGPRRGLTTTEKEAAHILGLTRREEGQKYVYIYPRTRAARRSLKRAVLPYPKPRGTR
jgi:hypothetical protein